MRLTVPNCVVVSGVLAMVLGLASAANAGRENHADPARIGPYAVGHMNLDITNTVAGDRSVAVAIWYPVDPEDIGPSTPQAVYPIDPTVYQAPSMTSADWEKIGYDRAYENPRPSHDGPFPLVVYSMGLGCDTWMYLYIGTRLASHGYVVAIEEGAADYQIPWAGGEYLGPEFLIETYMHRTSDVSFVISDLLKRNTTRGERLRGAIDRDRIAVGGHSYGGAAAFALAGGDDDVCDDYYDSSYNGDGWPFPDNLCVPILPDRRIKVLFGNDAVTQLLRFHELARISVPTLNLGESWDDMGSMEPGSETMMARAHAAIDHSVRAEIVKMWHVGFMNLCDGLPIMVRYGVLAESDLTAWQSSFCDPDISTQDIRQVVTTYLVAFLNVHLRGVMEDNKVLTPGYALHYPGPQVEFFRSEHCPVTLPDRSYYSARPYQVGDVCLAEPKDPADYFLP
ncbi:MAG TPA: hypothetical protein VMX54_20850 [Vicinamibacteria bacterium]|nr:hypothetical protein [Vicinamibacteria bacterium]